MNDHVNLIARDAGRIALPDHQETLAVGGYVVAPASDMVDEHVVEKRFWIAGFEPGLRIDRNTQDLSRAAVDDLGAIPRPYRRVLTSMRYLPPSGIDVRDPEARFS